MKKLIFVFILIIFSCATYSMVLNIAPTISLPSTISFSYSGKYVKKTSSMLGINISLTTSQKNLISYGIGGIYNSKLNSDEFGYTKDTFFKEDALYGTVRINVHYTKSSSNGFQQDFSTTKKLTYLLFRLGIPKISFKSNSAFTTFLDGNIKDITYGGGYYTAFGIGTVQNNIYGTLVYYIYNYKINAKTLTNNKTSFNASNSGFALSLGLNFNIF